MEKRKKYLGYIKIVKRSEFIKKNPDLYRSVILDKKRYQFKSIDNNIELFDYNYRSGAVLKIATREELDRYEVAYIEYKNDVVYLMPQFWIKLKRNGPILFCMSKHQEQFYAFPLLGLCDKLDLALGNYE